MARAKNRHTRPNTHPLPLWPRIGLGVAAGLVTGLGFAPIGWWPATIVGLVGFFWLVGRGAPRQAAGTGYAFGLGLFGLTISWVYVLGWWIAAAFVLFMALWSLLVGIGVNLVHRLPWWPLWAACVWSAFEFASSRVPFGGFGWVRLAFTTPDQPLSGYLPWIGVAGTSFLVALSAGLLSGLVLRGSAAKLRLASVIALVAIFGAGLVLLTRPVQTTTNGQTVDVGMVQGNVDGSAGPRAMGYARSVTANHVSETVMLMARARTGVDPMPDFVLWPENSSDMDPTQDATTADIIDAAAQLAGRPILVGAVMAGPGPNDRQTSALWWVPGQGIEARYDKRNAVPFGEFTPMQSLMFKLFPETKEVGKQTVPGTKPGVLHVTLPDGRPLAIGDIICYELAFDSTVYDTVRDGGQLITVQSNNATYTGTFQPRQQFAITRVRAMEMGRDIVVSTTSSFSGMIDAKGRVLDQTQESTAAAQTYQVPEQSGVTWGVRIGPWFERVASAIGCLAMIAGLIVAIRRREHTQH